MKTFEFKCRKCYTTYYTRDGRMPVVLELNDKEIYLCHKCEPQLWQDVERYRPLIKEKEPEPTGERVDVDQHSYQMLQWFRKNWVCMVLYRLCRH